MFRIQISGGGFSHDFEIEASQEAGQLLQALVGLNIEQSMNPIAFGRLPFDGKECWGDFAEKFGEFFELDVDGIARIKSSVRIPGKTIGKKLLNASLLTAVARKAQGVGGVRAAEIRANCKTRGFWRPTRLASVLKSEGFFRGEGARKQRFFWKLTAGGEEKAFQLLEELQAKAESSKKRKAEPTSR